MQRIIVILDKEAQEEKQEERPLGVQSRRSVLTFESMENFFIKALGVKSPWLTMLKARYKMYSSFGSFCVQEDNAKKISEKRHLNGA